MLYQELPRIDSTPLDGWGRWLAPALAGAAAITAAVISLLAGFVLLAGIAVLLGIAGAAVALRKAGAAQSSAEPLAAGPD